jgi:membrane-bound lytic murein transglycosylase F
MRVFSGLIIFSVALVFILNACAPQRSVLEQVIAMGELHVLTRNSGTTYFEGPQGPAGLEYELMRRFADKLGVELKVTIPDNLNEILDQISEGDAHIAAAGLTITDQRKQQVRFSPAYQTITQQVVYNVKNNRPRSLSQLDGSFEVVAHSSHVEQLNRLKDNYTDLSWTENTEADSTELLTLVAEDLIEYTIADSNEVAYNRRYYPKLRVAFDITKPQELAWAFPISDDDSLYNAAAEFLNELKESGELERLLKHNYQHVKNYDYAGTHSYLAQIRRRLPTYLEMFQKAAEEYDLDWRLLAAVSYQESHWRQNAVSPTGVRGMMMLTTNTAEQLGVEDRTDPYESIMGGAKYLRALIDKVPENIPEPDRVWIAVAAYNVGFGHVSDARQIAARRGDNPDKWVDIKATLPLLSKRKWYKQTRYGYARGWEPVRYVENIRSYYDILVWHLEKEQPHLQNIRNRCLVPAIFLRDI